MQRYKENGNRQNDFQNIRLFFAKKGKCGRFRNRRVKATGLPAWLQAHPASHRGKEASAAETPLKKDSCGRYRAHLPTQWWNPDSCCFSEDIAAHRHEPPRNWSSRRMYWKHWIHDGQSSAHWCPSCLLPSTHARFPCRSSIQYPAMKTY